MTYCGHELKIHFLVLVNGVHDIIICSLVLKYEQPFFRITQKVLTDLQQ